MYDLLNKVNTALNCSSGNISWIAFMEWYQQHCLTPRNQSDGCWMRCFQTLVCATELKTHLLVPPCRVIQAFQGREAFKASEVALENPAPTDSSALPGKRANPVLRGRWQIFWWAFLFALKLSSQQQEGDKNRSWFFFSCACVTSPVIPPNAERRTHQARLFFSAVLSPCVSARRLPLPV